MTPADEWITRETAAELVGCPVPTIDWYTRTGRIAHRPRQGNRPSLKASSVEDFATWWSDRQAARAKGRYRPESRASPGPGWLSSRAAAERLDVSVATVRRLYARGTLKGELRANRLWILETSLAKHEAERGRWISQQTAAELTGVGVRAAAVAPGELRARPVPHAVPSLDRDEVVRWAADRSQRKAEERKQRSAARATTAPPDDGQVGLDAETAALVIGVSRGWVRALAREDRLPHVMRGRRPWFLREHVEQAGAARVQATTKGGPPSRA